MHGVPIKGTICDTVLGVGARVVKFDQTLAGRMGDIARLAHFGPPEVSLSQRFYRVRADS